MNLRDLYYNNGNRNTIVFSVLFLYNAVMDFSKPRIGLLVASIHTGSARSLWFPLIKEASRSNISFFVFPGGRLNFEMESECLRNSIYRLANSRNLDGLISWGSAIGSSVPAEELLNFHKQFQNLPYVTIAHKIPGHPCVAFDAYSGMAKLVRHFITVHGASRIAFIRGPEYHVSASERFQAFCDIMAEHGIDMTDSPLVTTPRNWSEGAAAAEELFQNKKLIPGRDFQVLMGASDMMVLAAVKYFRRHGFFVPDNYCCAGFNDSPESLIAEPAFATVHLPYQKLGLTALSLIKDILQHKPVNTDVLLDTEVVIRESCGCSAEKILHYQQTVPADRDSFADFAAALFHLDDYERDAFIIPLMDAVVQKNESLFFSLLGKCLKRFFSNPNSDIRLLFQVFTIARQLPFLPAGYVDTLETRFFSQVAGIQNAVVTSVRYTERRLNELLNSLKCGLLAARSRENLVDILYAYLPKININALAIVLTETDDDEGSLFAGGFSDGTVYTGQIPFPAEQLLPDGMGGFSGGVFVVEPLFMEKQPIGYMVMTAPPYDGFVFEDLRSAISSALSGVFMFEQMAKAKQQAEEAEQAKLSFFANVGADLSEPLVEIARKVEQIEEFLGKDQLDQDLIAAQIIFIKNRIAEQHEKADLIMDLTLSQTNELPLEKRLFHIENVVGIPVFSFPLLYGDPDRLRQSLRLICDEWSVAGEDVQCEIRDDGILLSVKSLRPVTKDCWQQNNMQLAERILLLLGAKMTRSRDGCTILYPWPSFSCKPAQPGSALFEWNADTADITEWNGIYAKHLDKDFATKAFLCFTNCPDTELEKVKNFTALFEQKMSSAVKKPVLFIGSGGGVNPYCLWTSPDNTVFVPTITEFAASVVEYTPSLVVLDTLDCDMVEQIRTNPTTVMTPVLVLPETITDEAAVRRLMVIPRVILCNSYIAQSEEFAVRVRAVLAGEDILPPDTGALVKKAVCYLNRNSGSPISRWKLADSVHVSEDYLTRIFHKETGLSPWEYLNRYRIYLASKMLLHTNATVYDVAEKCGFQDQAYFCRVFKKIHGVPPGKYRISRDVGKVQE